MAGFQVNKEFIVYDKQQVKCDISKVSYYTNLYSNFGWELDKNVSTGIDGGEYSAFDKSVTINFRRDSMIDKKMELTRLQRIVEDYLESIDNYEKKKKEKANNVFFGFVGGGLLFIILGMFFSFSAVDLGPITPILFLVGIVCIGTPFFIYKKIVEQETKRIIPKIELKTEQVGELCEKAKHML